MGACPAGCAGQAGAQLARADARRRETAQRRREVVTGPRGLGPPQGDVGERPVAVEQAHQREERAGRPPPDRGYPGQRRPERLGRGRRDPVQAATAASRTTGIWNARMTATTRSSSSQLSADVGAPPRAPPPSDAGRGRRRARRPSTRRGPLPRPPAPRRGRRRARRSLRSPRCPLDHPPGPRSPVPRLPAASDAPPPSRPRSSWRRRGSWRGGGEVAERREGGIGLGVDRRDREGLTPSEHRSSTGATSRSSSSRSARTTRPSARAAAMSGEVLDGGTSPVHRHSP